MVSVCPSNLSSLLKLSTVVTSPLISTTSAFNFLVGGLMLLVPCSFAPLLLCLPASVHLLIQPELVA